MCKRNGILKRKCIWKCQHSVKEEEKKTVRIYVALLSKIEQPKPVLSCQKLKTLFFGSNILVFKFSLENAMFAMENVESKLLFFSPLLKSTFTSSFLKRTPLSIPGVMTSCADTKTALLQGPFIRTAVRSFLTTPGEYLWGFIILAASKKKKIWWRTGVQELLLPGCHSVSGQGTGAACPDMKDALCSSALPCGSQLWELGRSSFPWGIADARDHVSTRT